MKSLSMIMTFLLMITSLGYCNEFSGTVTDMTGNPVIRARIILVEPGIVEKTDYHGKFRVNVADISRFTLVIDASGYKKPMFEVDLTK